MNLSTRRNLLKGQEQIVNTDNLQITNISNGETITAQNIKTVETTTINPNAIEIHSFISRPTNFDWEIESNGRTYTAKDLEQMSFEELWNLDVVQNQQIIFLTGGNPDTHELWTDIANYNDINDVFARIKYKVPVDAKLFGEHIEFYVKGTKSKFGVDGLSLEINDDSDFQLIAISPNGIESQHDTKAPTYDKWVLPGANPEIAASDIEVMTAEERTNLIAEVESHGDIIRFVPNENKESGETWNDIIYNGDTVATIDRVIHQKVNITSNEIVIGSPVKLTITQQGIRWLKDKDNIQSIAGVVIGVAFSISGVNWAIHHPFIAGAGIYAFIKVKKKCITK